MLIAECETCPCAVIFLAMAKPVGEWTIGDVKAYLEGNELSEYTQGFLGKYFFSDIVSRRC